MEQGERKGEEGREREKRARLVACSRFSPGSPSIDDRRLPSGVVASALETGELLFVGLSFLSFPSLFLVRSAMIRTTAATGRTLARSQLPRNAVKPRRLHFSPPPHNTHTISSSSSSSHSSSSSSFASKRTIAAVAGATLLAGTAFAASSSSDDLPLLPPSVNPNDPLSSLDPAVLGRTTAHLTGATLSDLVRQWIVYGVSGQPLLVSSAPWIVGKLQWAKDNVPILGSAVWAVFALVRPPL